MTRFIHTLGRKPLAHLLLAGLLASPLSHGYECKDNIPTSHKPAQYVQNENGTVTDVLNGLLYSTCSIGQTWSLSAGCVGTSTNFADWASALKAAQADTLAGFEDWRLPNINELAALVERSCGDPAIDLSVFPSTPVAVYWSSTPDTKGTNAHANIPARIVDFSIGAEFVRDVSKLRLVRLVRPL